MSDQKTSPRKRLVIIGIDQSDFSEHAFNFYCDNLHQPENELLLIHSGELPHLTTSYSMYATGSMWDELLDKEKNTVRKLEDKYAELMKAHGLSGKIKAVFGHKPGDLICSEAKETHCSMIVLGTRGSGTVRRTIMGSVSDYVLHHAHCPVVVCRQ